MPNSDDPQDQNTPPESEPESEPKSEPESEPKSEPESEPKSEPESEPKPEPESENAGRQTPAEAAPSHALQPAAQAGPVAAASASNPPPPPEEPEEEDGMLRMSFLQHLEELRTRIIRSLMGLVVAFMISMCFMNQMWNAVKQPIVVALKTLGYPPELAARTPMEGISIVWFRVPILASIFIASPWVLYQVWAFIAPGLYKRERRWAVPFILTTAGLFITGGLFAYFIAFRFALTFLLKIGKDAGIRPYIAPTEYMDLFINVILGVALIFEMPVLIFFLTLLRIVTPKFLLKHSRYAILAIVIVAAIVTPTPDAVTMTLVATPMILLYFVGVFASFLLVLRREGRPFPWRRTVKPLLWMIAVVAVGVIVTMLAFHLHWVWKWPFLVK
jgi:sec-independent protein translocase protein TatC